jgi:hypothetical protein
MMRAYFRNVLLTTAFFVWFWRQKSSEVLFDKEKRRVSLGDIYTLYTIIITYDEPPLRTRKSL